MERPKPTQPAPTKREVTGEIMYLDAMRRAGQYPVRYSELTDAAVQQYQELADSTKLQGARPDIMDAYEACEPQLTDLELSCRALINELYKCNPQPEVWNLVGIHVDMPPQEVLAKLQKTKAGALLASENEQLALPYSEYYGEVDIRKCDSMLLGAGVTVWRWTTDAHTRDPQAPSDADDAPKVLYFPSGERHEWGEIDVNFSYDHPQSGQWTEKVTLYQGIQGDIRISSSVWASAYAETGYEGHGGTSQDFSEQEVAEFADFVAEIVGDEPITIHTYIERKVQAAYDAAATPEARQVIVRVVDELSSYSAYSLLYAKRKGGSYAGRLQDPEQAPETVQILAEQLDSARAAKR